MIAYALPHELFAARTASRPIPPAAYQCRVELLALDLDQVMATAYQFFQQQRYAEVDVLCETLIDADRGYWWCHSLRASALARLGRFHSALRSVERGLHHEPAHPKLLHLRLQILAAIGAAFVSRAMPARRGPRRTPPPPVTDALRRPGYGRSARSSR